MPASAVLSSFPRLRYSTSGLQANNGRELLTQLSRSEEARPLAHTSVTDAGIRGLELIPTLEVLNLGVASK
jgi:hypothetical protein